MKKSIQERLDAMNRQREAAVKAMTEVFDKASAEDRSFDDAEQKEFDTHRTEVASLDVQIKNLQDLAKLQLTTVGGVAGATGSDNGTEHVDTAGASGVDLGDRQILRVHRNVQKGSAFTRYAMALASSRGNLVAAEMIARDRYKTTPEVAAVLKAAVAAGTTTDTNWASPLSQYQDMQGEFIELLRPMTIMGRVSGFRNIPFNVRMPRQTSGATAGWVGQGAPKPVSKLQFDSVTMPHSKLAVIVAITEELARLSTPSAEATVRQDLLETCAQFIDLQMFDPAVAAQADISPGSITNGITGVASTGGTVAQVTADLNAAMTAMSTANIAMRSPFWVMHTRTANYLKTLRTTQDIYAFRDEMSRGQLLGIPYVASNNVPLLDQSNPVSPGSLEGYIALIDYSEIFLADDGETMLDVSREASLQMVTDPAAGAQALVSLWQNNMIGIRAERYVHWKRRRDAAVYVIDEVGY